MAAPGVEQVTAYQEEAGEKAVTTAQEPWLISVKGKLLETAPANSTAIAVTGLTPLAPQAGSFLEVPEEELTKLEALTGLLEALEVREVRGEVSAIRLESTYLVARYAGRQDAAERGLQLRRAPDGERPPADGGGAGRGSGRLHRPDPGEIQRGLLRGRGSGGAVRAGPPGQEEKQAACAAND